MVYGSVAVLAVMALVMGCPTTPAASGGGRPGAPNEDWNPDSQGNLQITNNSGRNADVFVNDRYIRTIEKGKSGFLINVTDATSAVGSEFMVTVYDNGEKGSLDAPAESAKMSTFAAALFPADDVDRRMALFLPPPEWRDKDAVAAGKPQVLVKFEYPLEDIALGTVMATVFEGQINSRRAFTVMNPQTKPVMVPMDPGFKQLSVLYTISTNNRVQRIYYPDWNDAAVDSSIRAFNTNDLNPTYTILPVSEIAKIKWVYPQDNSGKLIVRNRSSRPQQVEGVYLEPGGQRGLLEQLATGATGGSSALGAGDPPVVFQLKPGRYELSAKAALRNTVTSSIEATIEAGTQYYWIITDAGSNVERSNEITVASNLNKLIQNWKITSNVSGAEVTVRIDSSDSSLPSASQVLGNTNNSGALSGKFSLANLFSNLTYDNAGKALVKITVAKDGYISVSQTINALTLIQAGSDFVPSRFELAQQADKTSPGAVYVIENANFYDGE
jgi:hypothetical protein